MHYLSVENLTKTFSIDPVFENISFNISLGDKIAMIAKNGSGKTTLLRIIAGLEKADSGKVWVHKDVRVSFLDQDPKFDETKSAIDNVFAHKHPVIEAVKQYELLLEEENPDGDQLAEAMGRMDELNAWHFESTVQQILSRLKINHLDQRVVSMSGGQRKRLALAKVLIDLTFFEQHTLLIMDEPTNHLDFEMIDWLEHFLSNDNVTLLLVTHDRYFLDNVCNEVLEMDNGQIYVHRGNYEYFLMRRAEREVSEAASVDKARNSYRKELEWMRKQPKARTTKSKSRIDAFADVEAKAHSGRIEEKLELNMKMTRLGGKILELKKLYKNFGDKVILKGFDYTFKKGERIGIIGKNGAGKTTFLNIVQGLENADSGKINTGETVVFGYFSQQGLAFKEDQRVIEFVKNIAEHFPLADGTKLSAGKFLERFQFTPEQQFTYISKLSGGEKKRLQLLSILFTNPNFLILDEPTNDLDLITLTVLEEFLQEYQGCVMIVSHDRYFMDKLVDHLFIFDGDGVVRDFPGNYTQFRLNSDWKEESDDRGTDLTAKDTATKVAEQPAATSTATATAKRKFSYKEKTEFEKLEKEVPALEKQKEELNEKIAAGTLPYDELQKAIDLLGKVTLELEEKELRWLELSEIGG